jgi:hypothetical protein
LQRFFEVIVVYLDEVFLTRQVVLNVCYCDLTSCLDGKILNLFELHRFVTLRMHLEIVSQKRVPIRELMKLERFVTLLDNSLCLVFGHGLGLQHGSLVALTLENALFASILLDLRDL